MADGPKKYWENLTPEEEQQFAVDVTENTVPHSIEQAIQRRRERLNEPFAEQRYRQVYYDQQKKKLDDLQANAPGPRAGNDVLAAHQEQIQRQQDRLSALQEEFAEGGKWEQHRVQAADRGLMSSTNTLTGPRATHEQINRVATSVEHLGEINRRMADPRMTSTFLEKEAKRRQYQLEAERQNIASIAARGITSEDDEERYRQSGSEIQDHINELGIIKGIQTRQRLSRTDLPGRQRSAEELMSRVGASVMDQEIKSDVAMGKTGSLKTETSNLRSLQQEILEAGRAFSKAIQDGAENAEELGAAMDKLGEEYEKQEKIVKELERGGGRGGMGLGGWSGTVGDVLQAVAAGTMTMGVDNPLRGVGVRTGYANISNRQFFDMIGASSGDMSAFRRITTNQYAASGDYANDIGAMAATAVGTSAGADVAAGVNVAANAYSVNSVLSGTEKTGQAIGGAARYAASSAGKLQDVLMGLTSGEKRIQAFDAHMNLTDEAKKIFDTATQAYRDQMGGAVLSTRGAGSGRSGLFNDLDNAVTRMDFAKLGVGSQEMQSIYQSGVTGLGADFRGSRASIMAKRAAALQQGGLMGAQDYMASVGQLNAVGGAGDMESIMRNAVAAGMDSSRNIQQMVSGITGLAQKDALMGISTAAGAANLMGVAVQTSALRNLPAEMRVAAAAGQIGIMNKSMSDTSMNMYNVAEMFSLRQAAPDISMAQLTRFASLDLTQLATIRKDPSKAKEYGLDFLADNPQLLQKMVAASTRAELNKQGGLILTPGARSAMNQTIDEGGTWEDIPEQFRPEIKAAFSQRNLKAAFSFDTLGAITRNEVAKENKIELGEGKAGAGEKILAQQYEAMEKLNTRGQEAFKLLYGGLEGFNAKLRTITDNINVKDFQTQSEGAALNSELSVKKFEEGAGTFKNAVDKFTEALEDKLGVNIQRYKASPDDMAKKKMESARFRATGAADDHKPIRY